MENDSALFVTKSHENETDNFSPQILTTSPVYFMVGQKTVWCIEFFERRMTCEPDKFHLVAVRWGGYRLACQPNGKS